MTPYTGHFIGLGPVLVSSTPLVNWCVVSRQSYRQVCTIVVRTLPSTETP
jgi:hypothetical protein